MVTSACKSYVEALNQTLASAELAGIVIGAVVDKSQRIAKKKKSRTG